MAKRVKKGFSAKLLSGRSKYYSVEAREFGGVLRLYKHELEECMDLTVGQCEALGMTAVLEDAPEPWEQVRDVVFACAAVLECQAVGRHRLVMTDSNWRRVAETLGIKPGGE